ncbi:MAG: hypothetical protein ACLPSW_02035 [Roseiarcus sp.]
MALFKALTDRLLGHGEASIAVPILDGSFKPNTLLDQADVVGTFESPSDLATDGKELFLADGNAVRRLSGDAWRDFLTAEGPMTALACFDGGIAMAIDGKEVRIAGGRFDGKRWSAVNGAPFVSINAIASDGERLYVSDGSLTNAVDDWAHDLMNHGCTGRVIVLDPNTGSARILTNGLRYAFGAMPIGEKVWISETWRHRIRSVGQRNEMVLDHLPAYPGRMAPASDGGVWLCLFARRTQLVEFVLREAVFRRRMMKEIEPEHWIAPAFRSGDSGREPVQAGGIRSMGVLKPWAPPRSYGLVVRIDANGIPVYSIHSRVGAENHGIVAVAELGTDLFVLAKGPRRVLKLSIGNIEKEVAE